MADRLGAPGDVLRRRIRKDAFVVSFNTVVVLQLDPDARFLLLGVPSENVARRLEHYRPDISVAWNVSDIEFRVQNDRDGEAA